MTREEAEALGWTFSVDENRAVAVHAARELRTVSYAGAAALERVLDVVSEIEASSPTTEVEEAAVREEARRAREAEIRVTLLVLRREILELTAKVADGTSTAGERLRLSWLTGRACALLVLLVLGLLDPEAVAEDLVVVYDVAGVT